MSTDNYSDRLRFIGSRSRESGNAGVYSEIFDNIVEFQESVK